MIFCSYNLNPVSAIRLRCRGACALRQASLRASTEFTPKAQTIMKIPIVGVRYGKRAIAWRGVLAVALIVSGLSIGGFLAGRVLLDVLLGSTIPLLPGLVLAATLPVGVVLGAQLRAAWHLPQERLPVLPE